jgi:hypothetical protein
MSQLITTAPIPMIQENAQLVPTKLRLSYIYTGTFSAVTINLIGIDKRGHNAIASCTTVNPGAVEYASDIFIAIPQGGDEFPFICLSYIPVAGFRILGTPELILEAREYPDVLSSNVYTEVVLT